MNRRALQLFIHNLTCGNVMINRSDVPVNFTFDLDQSMCQLTIYTFGRIYSLDILIKP
jgi:hypothetical protein